MSRGTMQDVKITSSPAEATIFVDQISCGQTPQIVAMSRKYSHHVVLIKEGYQMENYFINPECSGPRLAGNLAYIGVGTCVGAAISIPFISASMGMALPCFAILGGLAGAVISLGGVTVDITSGCGYQLDTQHVHFPLTPAP